MHLKKNPEEIPLHTFEEEDNQLFGFEHFDPRVDINSTEPHRHDYYEIFIFNTGGGEHIIDFRTLKIEPLSAHIVAPGQVHHLKRTNACQGQVLMFKEGFLKDDKENREFISKFNYLEIEQLSPAFRFKTEEFREIRQMLEGVENETKSTHSLNMDIIRGFLNIIILRCRQHIHLTHDDKLSPDQLLHAEFRKEVDQKFREFKMVKDYASLLNTSEKRLNEVSKRNSGKSASAIIYDRIIKEAKRLMVNTELSVKEICFNLEYDDPAHFTKFFKSQSGHSPSEFRKLYK